MRRAYVLIVIVIILVFSAFAVSFGWYYYAKQSVKEFVGIEEKIPQPEEIAEEKAISQAEIPLKNVVLKLGERAAYRKPSGARIVVDVENAGNFVGDAEI